MKKIFINFLSMSDKKTGILRPFMSKKLIMKQNVKYKYLLYGYVMNKMYL